MSRATYHDARIERTRATVLSAAAQLLAQRGPAAFTVEAVVERSGVALTTVYRHWPSRSELLAAAIALLGEPPPIPDTGSVRDDLIIFHTSRAHEIDGQWDQRLRTMPGLIEAGRHDPNLSAVVEQTVSGVLKAVRLILERGQDRGELAADRDLDLKADLILGAIFLHHSYRSKALTDDYITEVVDTVIGAFS